MSTNIPNPFYSGGSGHQRAEKNPFEYQPVIDHSPSNVYPGILMPTHRFPGLHDADVYETQPLGPGETVESYRGFVDRLWKHDERAAELAHIALGLAGEAGEIVDAIKKNVVYHKDLDIGNLLEELGDLRYYMQALMNMYGWSMDLVEGTNMRKLNARYPQGSYSNQQAIDRADKN